MASNKNITMRQFNGTDYDYLYPRTTTGQVSGLYDNIYTKSQSDDLYLKTNGSNAMTGNLNVGNHYLSNVANPVSPQDGATKQYVDNQISNGLYSVNIAYNGNVRGTYSPNDKILTSAAFSFENAIGIYYSMNINVTNYAGRYIGLQILSEQILRNNTIDRPPAVGNVAISGFTAFLGRVHEFNSNASEYYGVTLEAGDFSLPFNTFSVPSGVIWIKPYEVSDGITIAGGYMRMDVIYHR